VLRAVTLPAPVCIDDPILSLGLAHPWTTSLQASTKETSFPATEDENPSRRARLLPLKFDFEKYLNLNPRISTKWATQLIETFTEMELKLQGIID